MRRVRYAVVRTDSSAACDPGLCPDALDGEGRCGHCALDRIDDAQASEKRLSEQYDQAAGAGIVMTLLATIAVARSPCTSIAPGFKGTEISTGLRVGKQDNIAAVAAHA